MRLTALIVGISLCGCSALLDYKNKQPGDTSTEDSALDTEAGDLTDPEPDESADPDAIDPAVDETDGLDVEDPGTDTMEDPATDGPGEPDALDVIDEADEDVPGDMATDRQDHPPRSSGLEYLSWPSGPA